MSDYLTIKAQSELQTAIKQLQGLSDAIGKVTGEEKKNAPAAGEAAKQTENLAGAQGRATKTSTGLSNAVAGLGAALGALGLAQHVKDSVRLFVEQEQAVNILTGATGDIKTAREEYERWRDTTSTLGLEFQRSAVLYARLLTTVTQAGIPIEHAKSAADGLAIAQRAMNLSSYEGELAFRALGQIANKAVVNLEELRQQLGERVAGVMDALSKKMGITTRELFSLTETGELSAKVFFEKFGPAMAEAFRDQAVTNADSLAANMERINNAANALKVSFAGGFADELSASIKSANSELNQMNQYAKETGAAFGAVVGVVSKIGQVVVPLFRAIGLQLQATLADFAQFAVKASAFLADILPGDVAERFSKRARRLAEDIGFIAEGSRDTAIQRYKEFLDAAGLSMEEGSEKARDFKKEIDDLADGTENASEKFNKLDPEIAKFIERVNELGKKTEITVEGLRRMMDAGPLDPAQLAAAKKSVEDLVRAYDFKGIPPELKSLADQLGVATTKVEKHTQATKAMKDAYSELLKELKAVNDELKEQSEAATEAAEENAARLAELDNALVLNPEDFNEQLDRRGKQVQLDREAREAREAFAASTEDLERAELAAAAASGEFSGGVNAASAALGGFAGAADGALSRLAALEGGFSGAGGAAGSLAARLGAQPGIGPAGTFGTGPGGLSGAPGASVRPFGFGIGGQAPGGGLLGIGGSLALHDAGVGDVALREGVTRSPGLSTNTGDIIAGIIAEQLLAQLGQTSTWEDEFQSAAIAKAAAAAMTGEIGKVDLGGAFHGDQSGDVGIGQVSRGSFDPKTGEIKNDTEKIVTNIKDGNEELDISVDRWQAVEDSLSGANQELIGYAESAEDAGDAALIIADSIDVVAKATDGLPGKAQGFANELNKANAAGDGLAGSIQRADTATGNLGFTADATAGSIAEAAGAAVGMGEQVARESARAANGMEQMKSVAGQTSEELEKQLQILVKINRLLVGGGNEPAAPSDIGI